MTVPPVPTPLLRLIHIDNLAVVLQRGGMHAPNHTPADGLTYRPIHDVSVQQSRSVKTVPLGAGGSIHDYVPFYFGYRSVMLLKLKTGQVQGYTDGQRPLIYLVTSAQRVHQSAIPFVFADGHGLAAFSSWYDDLAQLDQVPWDVVNLQYWNDTTREPDRQRRKQAEFLVHRLCPWDLVEEIAVYDEAVKVQVESVLTASGQPPYPSVQVRRNWYYP